MKSVFINKLLLFTAACGLLQACSKDPVFVSEVADGPAPTASFTNTSGSLDISFTNTSENGDTYYWQFGDGTSSTEASPVHNYATAGRYTVNLKTNSAAGYSADTSMLIVVASKAEARFAAALSSGVYIEFSNTSVSLDSCTWNFGDGSAATNEIAPAHAFPAPGRYPVTLTVYGIGGDTAIITETVTVNGECINGGSFEVTDAQSWTIWSSQADNPPTFGYTTDKPSTGAGGCLRFPSFTAPSNGSKNELLYQRVYVEAGKKYQFSAQVKLPAGGSQCYMQFYLSNDANTWNENDGNPPTQLFVSLNTWHGWGGTSGSGPTVAVDGSIIEISHDFGEYGPYAADGIYTAATTGWMYLGIQAGSWSGYSSGDYLVDEVSFKLLP